MSSERGMRPVVRRHLAPYGKVVRIESPCEGGTPDLLYCFPLPSLREPATGWIEFKCLERWPVRDGTVFIQSLTLEQVTFLEDWPHPGRAWLLLHAEHEWLLLAPPLVRAMFIRRTRAADLREHAAIYSNGKFPTVELIRCLTA